MRKGAKGMRWIGLASLIVALSFGVAAAQVAAQGDPSTLRGAIERCASNSDDAARLRCFDDLAGEPRSSQPSDPQSPTGVAVVPPGSASGRSGGWMLVRQEDPFENRNTSMAVLSSVTSTWVGRDAPRELVVRCDGRGGSEIFVVSSGYIGGSNNRTQVRFRFGDERPVSERWSSSTSGTGAFLPSGHRDFRNGLATRQDFVFELTDYRGSRSSARFDGVADNDQHLEYVLNGCR